MALYYLCYIVLEDNDEEGDDDSDEVSDAIQDIQVMELPTPLPTRVTAAVSEVVSSASAAVETTTSVCSVTSAEELDSLIFKLDHLKVDNTINNKNANT